MAGLLHSPCRRGTSATELPEVSAYRDIMQSAEAVEAPPSIADVLRTVLGHEDDVGDGKISLDDIVGAFGNRAFGILFLLFGLPNCFPMPPGIPVLCGIVVGVVALQMLLGRQTLVLPRWLGSRRIARSLIESAIGKSKPVLRRLEAISRPRYPSLTGDLMRRAVGLAGLALAVALMAPIPIFGGIPAGIAVTVLGLALTQRDGILLSFGIVVATPIALGVTSAMVFALVQGASAML